jgi:excinuclease ABC subunit C
LESQLIKKYQPKFNVLFKDDKNYFYVGFTSEDWPRVFITHQPKNEPKKLKSYELKADYAGPFVSGTALKETLKILRKIFPYRSCKTLPTRKAGTRPCLWYELNRCPAPCLINEELKEKPELKKQLKERARIMMRIYANIDLIRKSIVCLKLKW